MKELKLEVRKLERRETKQPVPCTECTIDFCGISCIGCDIASLSCTEILGCDLTSCTETTCGV